MPCSDKWRANTRRRISLTRRGGIGNAFGQTRAFHPFSASPYQRYQPGCQPIQAPGVSLNYVRMQSGYYVPWTIRGAQPIAYTRCPPCPGPCGPLHDPGIGAPPRGGATPGIDTVPPAPGIDPGPVPPPGLGGPGAPGFCNPAMGMNWAQTGCAPGTRPDGLYWGFQNQSCRYPRGQRREPYPVGQQPYWVGKSVPYYAEPFAGCPTRSAPYWVRSDPWYQRGIGETMAKRVSYYQRGNKQKSQGAPRGAGQHRAGSALVFPRSRGVAAQHPTHTHEHSVHDAHHHVDQPPPYPPPAQQQVAQQQARPKGAGLTMKAMHKRYQKKQIGKRVTLTGLRYGGLGWGY